MTPIRLSIVLAIALLAGACAGPERSRNLADPAVPALALAQQVCSNCHGLGGTAISPNFPNLAAQNEGYLVAQLNGYRSHSRQDPAGFEYMWGLSRSLTDAQVAGLAAYYAAQTPRAQALEGDPMRLAAGQAIYEQGIGARNVPACASCHGPQGAGLAAFPRLASQHADYVVKQLQVFQRSNDRPEGAIMKTVAHELTPQDIEDIAAYVQSIGNR